MKTKDFPYGSQSSRMLCSVRYGLQGGRLGFLWIKVASLMESPHIYATVRGSTSLYQTTVESHKEESPNLNVRTKVTRFNDARARL